MLVCPTQTYTYIHTLSCTQFGILTHTCTNCFPDVTHTYPHSRMPTCTRAYTIYRYECTTTPTVVQIYAHTYTTNRHTTLHSIYEMCVHARTPSPPANTNTFTNTKKRVCTLTNTHESRSQARMRINTDHVLSSAVCLFVMPASCHQVVASELARCPAKIDRVWTAILLAPAVPDLPRGAAPLPSRWPRSTLWNPPRWSLRPFPSQCRVGGGRARARVGRTRQCP